jgi:predicted RNA-binding protein with PIN domain
MKVIVTTSDMASRRLGSGLLLVVPDARKDETHSAMIERIVADCRDAPSEVTKNVCVVHSSLDVLKQCKPFLGEDA